jgi:hypothetical protein
MTRLVCLSAVIVASVVASVSAQEAKLEIENEWVRVFREARAPHAKAEMREHPATVTVYLSDAHERLIGSDGKVKDVRQKHGGVAYFDAGKYAYENVSNAPIKAVVVELKDPAGKPRSPPITLDPVRLDAKHHRVPLENDRVRVLHTILVPHLKSPMHEHPHYVVVYLTELHTTQALPDGRIVDNPRVAGEIAWREALKHVTENIGEHTAEEIQIELK